MGVLIVLTVSIACDSIADNSATSSPSAASSVSPSPSPTLCPGCVDIQGEGDEEMALSGVAFYKPPTTEVAFSADEIIAMRQDEQPRLSQPMKEVILARYTRSDPAQGNLVDDHIVWVFNVDSTGQPAPGSWPAGVSPPACEAQRTFEIWLFDAQTGEFVSGREAWNWPCLTPGPER
jgi:hypothetical protein